MTCGSLSGKRDGVTSEKEKRLKRRAWGSFFLPAPHVRWVNGEKETEVGGVV